MCPRPIVLLTDFGTADAYAGVLECVLAARSPGSRCITLTHGIRAGDIRAGSFQLLMAAPYLPPESVVLGVVDPGVGGPRRPIILTSGGHAFVGPDNGLLWPAARSLGPPAAFAIRPEWAGPRSGETFHGRDVFGPAAAALATGLDPAAIGTPIDDPAQFDLPQVEVLPNGIRAEVIYIDHFGNAVTSARAECLPVRPEVRVQGKRLPGPLRAYAEVAPGEPLALVNSSGYLEIAVREGNAAQELGLHLDDIVTVNSL